MGKFKIGDRVRVLPRDKELAFSGHGADAGKEYTVKAVRGNAGDNIDTEVWSFFDHEIELVPTFTITADKFYRTRNGKVTGRVSKGDTGFEAVVDGKVRVYDAAGGHVHGDADLDIVEAWVPRIGERVRFVRDNTDGGAKYGAKGDVVTVMSEGSDIANCEVDVSSSHLTWNPGAYLSDLEPLPVAAPQPAAALKIEAGKFYRTRDGRKVGPLTTTDNNEFWPFRWPDQTMYYKADGFSCPGSARLHRDEDDLIAEWVDEPVAVAAPAAAEASNDNKPKFKVGDRVFARYGDLCGNGTVTHVDTDDDDMPYRVDFGAEGTFWCYDEDVTSPQPEAENDNKHADVQNSLAITIDTGNVHEALDEIIAKLKKIKKLQRQVGLAA